MPPPRPQEHPRARGENPDLALIGVTGSGTSPRTRGKRSRGASIACDRGNIPAHAGKTMVYDAETGITREHPRARGENGEGNKGVE